MNEVVPGIFHWTAVHPDINIPVSSYYVEPARMLLDPLTPEDGIEALDRFDPAPEVVVLTIGLHWRHTHDFRDRYGCTVRAPSAGMHRFEDSDRDADWFEFGDEIAPGVVAYEVGGIAPDDTALHIAHGRGAMSFADGIHTMGGEVAFMPDEYLEEPEEEKRAIRYSLRRLLEHDFDTLLFAHGDPMASGGHAALEKFVGADD